MENTFSTNEGRAWFGADSGRAINTDEFTFPTIHLLLGRCPGYTASYPRVWEPLVQKLKGAHSLLLSQPLVAARNLGDPWLLAPHSTLGFHLYTTPFSFSVPLPTYL